MLSLFTLLARVIVGGDPFATTDGKDSKDDHFSTRAGMLKSNNHVRPPLEHISLMCCMGEAELQGNKAASRKEV